MLQEALKRVKDTEHLYYEQEVNEAECQIAYHQEGERLSGCSFPFLRDYKESVKPFYRKIGGLHFLSLGRIRVSFCLTKG